MEQIKRAPTTKGILRVAAKTWGVSEEWITRKTRKREHVRKRQIVQYMAYRITKETAEYIAKQTGVEKHRTVLHSHSMIAEQMELYADLKFDVWVLARRMEEDGMDPTAPYMPEEPYPNILNYEVVRVLNDDNPGTRGAKRYELKQQP